MVDEQQLRQLVARMIMEAPESIGADTSLRSLDNSLGGAKLSLGLKRLGFESPFGFRPTTFGDLQRLLAGGVTPAPAPAGPEPVIQASPEGLQVGLDVQDIAALPPAADFWEHDFYQGLFASSEIAYAVVQSDPRSHLAGFWCAKEALRKCDPSFGGVDPAATAVEHEQNGRPYLLWKASQGDVRLPHALSISHAGGVATAIAILIPVAKPTPVASVAEAPLTMQAEPRAEIPAKTTGRGQGWFTTFFVLIFLGAVYALTRLW
ncbi:MAG TPA: 4'-phosphopantetheinyl transferase superfamily protein [Bryobacteraceae bacterium]|nr:4'-phosphopantetheinyl transferase superfamily protein [Bryobacteraceae bacterium]